MASPTYRTRGIVVRKRALGEADLVVSLLDESGAKVAAVAKGARKPASTFSSRLELFSSVDVLLARGRTLDIVKEARLVRGHGALRCDYELTLAASVAADAVDHLAQESLEQQRIFPMTEALLTVMEGASPASGAALAAAFLLKALATFGYRPALDACAACGAPVSLARADGQNAGGYPDNPFPSAPFSVGEGGVLCPGCASQLQAQPVSALTLANAQTMIESTFSALAVRPPTPAETVDLLRLANLWMGYHTGIRLKSLEQLVLGLQRCHGGVL